MFQGLFTKYLGALVVIVEPPGVVSDHLVVVIIEELCPLAGPDISQQGVVHPEPPKGVSSHDGDDLLPGEAETVLEELNSPPPISHDVQNSVCSVMKGRTASCW